MRLAAVPAGTAPGIWRSQAACSGCRIARQYRPHEGPLVAEHAAALIPDAIRFDEIRIGAEQCTVLLIGSQARETEQREGLVARSLGRQEVAVMHAAL